MKKQINGSKRWKKKILNTWCFSLHIYKKSHSLRYIREISIFDDDRWWMCNIGSGNEFVSLPKISFPYSTHWEDMKANRDLILLRMLVLLLTYSFFLSFSFKFLNLIDIWESFQGGEVKDSNFYIYFYHLNKTGSRINFQTKALLSGSGRWKCHKQAAMNG